MFLTRNFRRIRTLAPMSILEHTNLPIGAISMANILAMGNTRNIPMMTSVIFRRMGRKSTRVVMLPNKLPKTAGLSTRRNLNGLVVAFTRTKHPLSTVYTTPLMCKGHNLLGNGGMAYCPKFRGCLRNTRCATTLMRGSNGFVANGKPNTTVTFSFTVTRGCINTRGIARLGRKVVVTR